MTNIALITDKYRAYGFKLANISHVFDVETREDTMKILDKLMGEDYGILLVTDNIVPLNDSKFSGYLRRTYPSVIIVPTGFREEEMSQYSNIEVLIQHSIGFSIKL